jgi:hypothetical protein
VTALQLSQAGPFEAWSVGPDKALVCTDLTTCQMRASTNPPRGPEINPAFVFPGVPAVSLCTPTGVTLIRELCFDTVKSDVPVLI